MSKNNNLPAFALFITHLVSLFQLISQVQSFVEHFQGLIDLLVGIGIGIVVGQSLIFLQQETIYYYLNLIFQTEKLFVIRCQGSQVLIESSVQLSLKFQAIFFPQSFVIKFQEPQGLIGSFFQLEIKRWFQHLVQFLFILQPQVLYQYFKSLYLAKFYFKSMVVLLSVLLHCLKQLLFLIVPQKYLVY